MTTIFMLCVPKIKHRVADLYSLSQSNTEPALSNLSPLSAHGNDNLKSVSKSRWLKVI